jgi:hypothetical protein
MSYGSRTLISAQYMRSISAVRQKMVIQFIQYIGEQLANNAGILPQYIRVEAKIQK